MRMKTRTRTRDAQLFVGVGKHLVIPVLLSIQSINRVVLTGKSTAVQFVPELR